MQGGPNGVPFTASGIAATTLVRQEGHCNRQEPVAFATADGSPRIAR